MYINYQITTFLLLRNNALIKDNQDRTNNKDSNLHIIMGREMIQKSI